MAGKFGIERYGLATGAILSPSACTHQIPILRQTHL